MSASAAYLRSWSARNQAKRRAYRVKYRQEHPDLVRRQIRSWRDRNREKFKLQKLRRRALRNGATGTCSAPQLRARIQYYGSKCWVPGCGKPYEAIDHVIALSCGGSNWPANLRPICKSHNSIKTTKHWTSVR